MIGKRLTWLGIGVVAGLGGSKWLERRLRRALGQYLPARRSPAGRRSALAELRFAIAEGRSAMAEREAELRRALRPGGHRGEVGGRPRLQLVPTEHRRPAS